MTYIKWSLGNRGTKADDTHDHNTLLDVSVLVSIIVIIIKSKRNEERQVDWSIGGIKVNLFRK